MSARRNYLILEIKGTASRPFVLYIGAHSGRCGHRPIQTYATMPTNIQHRFKVQNFKSMELSAPLVYRNYIM